MTTERAEDGRYALLDPQRLEEIALLGRLMIEATSRSGPLSQREIDQLLEPGPIVLPVQSDRRAVRSV